MIHSSNSAAPFTHDPLDAVIKSGKVFTDEVLKLDDCQKTRLFFNLNTSYTPFVACVLAEAKTDELKREFIYIGLKHAPYQFNLVPQELVDSKMALLFISGLFGLTRPSVEKAYELVERVIANKGVATALVAQYNEAYYLIPENIKTPELFDTFATNAISYFYRDLDKTGASKKILETITSETKYEVERHISKLVEKFPAVFTKLPDRLKTESVCRTLCLRHPFEVETVAAYVNRDIYREIVLKSLESLGFSSAPKKLLIEMSRLKSEGPRKLLAQAIKTMGVETFIEHCSTPRQAISLQEIFGIDALPENMKNIKAAKRHAVSTDLGL